MLSLQSVPSTDRPSAPELRANAHGFSLHAAVRWGADQRKELEHLCRYITRPAIANERLKRNRAGDVVLQLKSTFKDGTTHIVMSPLEFMQRLAALVPRPRLHLIRFHGVLAPGAKLRCKIIPSSAERATEASTDDAPAQGAPARLSWARLLKRVFDIDIENCPNCGGALKIIAAIEDPPVIVRILTYLGPRPGAASRFIPDNLRAENRLPTQADGAARSEFERKRTQWALTKEEMKNCVWLKPELVAQIEFTEWTPDGHLRHSKFVGLREDKEARDVVRER